MNQDCKAKDDLTDDDVTIPKLYTMQHLSTASPRQDHRSNDSGGSIPNTLFSFALMPYLNITLIITKPPMDKSILTTLKELFSNHKRDL